MDYSDMWIELDQETRNRMDGEPVNFELDDGPDQTHTGRGLLQVYGNPEDEQTCRLVILVEERTGPVSVRQILFHLKAGLSARVTRKGDAYVANSYTPFGRANFFL